MTENTGEILNDWRLIALDLQATIERLEAERDAMIIELDEVKKQIAALQTELEARRGLMSIGSQVVDHAELIADADPVNLGMLWLSVKTYRKWQHEFFMMKFEGS